MVSGIVRRFEAVFFFRENTIFYPLMLLHDMTQKTIGDTMLEFVPHPNLHHSAAISFTVSETIA